METGIKAIPHRVKKKDPCIYYVGGTSWEVSAAQKRVKKRLPNEKDSFE